jgi:AcrR family transcriptional regulator
MPTAPNSPTVGAEQLYEELWVHVQADSSRRLLISALDCFALKGFEGASAREIAERAGMSPAGLYVDPPSGRGKPGGCHRRRATR